MSNYQTTSFSGGKVKVEETVALDSKCIILIQQSACLLRIRENVLVPIMSYFAFDSEESITLKTDPIKLVWMIFRQGSFMCELLNQVQPGVIKSVTLPVEPIGSSNFSDVNSRQNVATFIKACRDMFFLTDEQLFNPGDLYKEDFVAFSKALNLCEMYLKNKIRVSSRTSYCLNDYELDEETKSLFDMSEAESNEEARESYVSEPREKSKRENLLEELIASERVYVNDLALLNQYKEMVKFDRILDASTLESILPNLREILNFQKKFLMEMESETRKPEPDFGELFSRNEADFDVYTSFCINQDKAVKILNENKEKLARTNQPGDLSSFLIKPLQRVMKYSLFMRDLMKEAHKSGLGDVDSLNRASNCVKRIANRINDEQRAKENEIVATEFFSHFPAKKLSLEKTGKLIFFTPLLKIKVEDYFKPYRVYVFERKIVLCGEKELFGPFWIKYNIAISSVRNVEEFSTSESDLPFSVEIMTNPNDSEATGFTAFFPTEESSRLWADTVRKVAGLPVTAEPMHKKEVSFQTVQPEQQQPQLNYGKTYRYRIHYQNESLALVFFQLPTLSELTDKIHEELAMIFGRTLRNATKLPEVEEMLLMYMEKTGARVYLTNDVVLQSISKPSDFLDVVLYEPEMVRIRCFFNDDVYAICLDEAVDSLLQLKNYIRQTIKEIDSSQVPELDDMGLLFKEPTDGLWSHLIYDNDLNVALKISAFKIDVKLIHK